MSLVPNMCRILFEWPQLAFLNKTFNLTFSLLRCIRIPQSAYDDTLVQINNDIPVNVVPSKPQQPPQLQPRTSVDPLLMPAVPAATPSAKPSATGATTTSGEPNNSQTELLVLSGALVDALLAHRDHLVCG